MTIKTILTTTAGFLGLIVLLNACGTPGKDTNGEQRAITDMTGRRVQVPDTVESAIGIEAGALRLLVYMQATNRVAGVEDIEKRSERPYTMAHPKLKELPVIGPVHGGDPELITAQQPDVIFWTYTTAGKADELQRKTGIPVIALQYGNINSRLDSLFAALKLMGRALGNPGRAQEVQDFMQGQIASLQSRTNTIADTARAYIGGISYRGGHGIESTEPRYAPFRFNHIHNVASGTGEVRISPGGNMNQAMMDKEQILEWDPDWLFADAMNLTQVMKDIADHAGLFSSMRAIRKNQAYTVMPYNYYTTNFATVLANAWFIGKTVYPERFSDVQVPEKAAAIYQFMLGKNVQPDMAKMYGPYRKINLKLQ